MAVTGVNNYTDYTNYYTDTKQVSEGTQKTADKQIRTTAVLENIRII